MPRTKSEALISQDEKIKEVGETGTQNILDVIKDDCKIIMPSSHVVYEGMEKVKNNIKEGDKTSPKLAYGKSKDFNEKQLMASGKNYIILRLGSVYGYSTDTARIDIMANFFSKIASQNGTLKLFAGGRQIKSLVPLIDVARCFKFMEERTDLNFDLFNLTKDTVTVKGGVLIALAKKFKLPIICLGLGEKEDDLQIFDARIFADAFTQIN